ncbi:MAG: penicillin-binding protein 1A [Burkholderiales bacterium]|nr:MAG: penicillin-binding protein 1A [Burkholderiales bacterium]
MPDDSSKRASGRSGPGSRRANGSRRARARRGGRASRRRGTVLRSLLAWLLLLPLVAAVSAVLVGAVALLVANDRLPDVASLVEYRPKVPLRVYTSDGFLIGEFGEERRAVVRIEEVPVVMQRAILAAEDDRFFEHVGIDFIGLMRAVLANLAGDRQGASTITMQVAKNFFFDEGRRDIAYKVFQMLLALRIEQALTKPQILELYINQIYLGQRAYGFSAAASAYFGKTLPELTVAEAAMLAGLPKAPSRYNPIVNPRRAQIRQRYVLGRMRELGFLTEPQYEQALAEPLALKPGGLTRTAESAGKPVAPTLSAPYVAEMARQLVYDPYQERTYSAGLSVFTTIRARDQQLAEAALRSGVLTYDRRHGYRGPEAFVDLPGEAGALGEFVEETLAERPQIGDLEPALVLATGKGGVTVTRGNGERLQIEGAGLKFAASGLSSRAPATRRLRRGAVVRIARMEKGGYEIVQLPEVEAAFVSVDAADGAVRALVGGFDFSRNKFNRVTQAWRQPGSSFKPFVYSAALEKGIMTSTYVNDAPIVIDPAITGGQLWEPKNYDGEYEGPMTLREGLARSKNMVSIRVLEAIGTTYAQDYVTRFGFDPERHPPYLTMALGAGAVTPLQMAGAYAVFANGGYRVRPYLVNRIVDSEGRVLAQAQPLRAGDAGMRLIDPRNAFIMDSMLRNVVRSGTARRALALNRADVAGKTGTTNDSHDAWFAGYHPSVVAVAWVGFDQPRKLGNRETGGRLALPIWMDYMQEVLPALAVVQREPPPGVVQIGDEYYYTETVPGIGVATLGVEDGLAAGDRADHVRDQIF